MTYYNIHFDAQAVTVTILVLHVSAKLSSPLRSIERPLQFTIKNRKERRGQNPKPRPGPNCDGCCPVSCVLM